MKRCFLGILLLSAVLVPLSQSWGANGTVLPPAPNSTWEPGLAYQALCISPPLVNQSCNVILLQNGNSLKNLGQVMMNQVGMANFKWTIPMTQAKGGGYQIRFANQSNSIFVDSATFNIGTVQRTLKLTQPANITQAKAGDTVMLSWTYTGHTGSVSEEENTILPTICGYYYYGKVPIGSNGSGSFAYKIPADFKDTPSAAFGVHWKPHGSTGEINAVSPSFHLINDSQRESAGYIDVLTPQAGQAVNVGSVLPITWKHANWMSGQVNIYMGDYDNPLAVNVPIGANGTGTYNWKVNEFPRYNAAGHYITIQNVAKTHKGVSGKFTIVCSQPGITINAPGANDVWEVGTMRYIAWQSGLPASTPFDIELVEGYSNRNIRTIYTGLTAVQQGGSLVYGWSIPAAYPTGNYAIRISKNGSGGCPAASSPVTLAGPGKIYQISPFTGASITQKEVMHIAWETLANYNNLYVKIDLYRGIGTKVMNIAPAVLIPDAKGQIVYGMTAPSRTTYDWTVPTAVQPGNDYYFVFELSGLNAVTVRSTDPKATGQKTFTVNPAPVEPRPMTITPVLPKAPINPIMPLQK